MSRNPHSTAFAAFYDGHADAEWVSSALLRVEVSSRGPCHRSVDVCAEPGGNHALIDRGIALVSMVVATDTIMGPVHPGEILLEEFLKPLSVSQYHLAKEIGVPARRVNEIVHGQRRISADTALRLARFFGTSERFWINLQSRYDLEVEKDRLGNALDGIRPLTAAS